MVAIKNEDVQDQGVNWVVSYDWADDAQTQPFQHFSASFPAAFGDLNPDEVTTAMLDLAMAVARGRGVHD